MPVEQGYQSQVGPAQAAGPVMVSPDAMGAGIGATLAQAGAAQHGNELRAYQVQRQQAAQDEAADFYHKLAKAQISIDDATNKARETAGPGGAGHVETMQNVLDAQRDQLFSGITEQSVLRHAQEQWDGYATRVISQAGDWQYGQQIGKRIVDGGQAADRFSERVRLSSDPATAYPETLKAFHGMMSTMALPPEAREKLTRQGEQNITTARIQNGFDRDPAAELALIRGGAYTGIYSQPELERLINTGEAEVRRREAEGRIQRAAGKAEFNQQYSLFMARAHDGEDVAAGDAVRLAQAATAYGELDKARELGRAVEDQGFAKQYRAMATNPAAMQQHIAELSAKAKPSPVEQRELAWAQEHASGLASKFSGDPTGYLATYGPRGTQPPALDMADPKTVIARAQWAQVVTGVTGQTVPPLSDAEMAPLRQRIAQGPAGRLEALQQLDALPSVTRAHWARAIMPNDKLFQQEAQVAPGVRATIQAGREAEKGNAGYWPSTNPKDAVQARSAQQLANFDAMLAFAMKGMDPADVRAAQQNMRNYIAGRASAQGKANAHSIGGSDLKEAAASALGGQIKDGRQYGGIAQWSGPQSFVVIPETMTSGQFGAAMIHDRAAQDRAGSGPVNPNGTPFDLKRAVPVLVGDGLYRWETSSGVVLNKKGQPYVSRIGGR